MAETVSLRISCVPRRGARFLVLVAMVLCHTRIVSADRAASIAMLGLRLEAY